MPLIVAWQGLIDRLERAGRWAGLLPLRWLLAWEHFEAGWTKFTGENWFAGIRQQFPWPFDLLPPALNWQLATWAELLGGVLLFLGLVTRPVVVVLMGLTLVATWAVHLPDAWPGLLALQHRVGTCAAVPAGLGGLHSARGRGRGAPRASARAA